MSKSLTRQNHALKPSFHVKTPFCGVLELAIYFFTFSFKYSIPVSIEIPIPLNLVKSKSSLPGVPPVPAAAISLPHI
jgi:hypothetical protein